MKRGRATTRGAARRVLRRKNVVQDDDDSEEDKEEASEEEEEAGEAGEGEEEEEEEEEPTPKKLTRAQAKKQEEEKKAERREQMKQKLRKSTTRKQKADEEEEEEEDDEEDEEDDEEDDEEEEEEEEEEGDDEDDEDEEEEEEEADVSERAKRTRVTTRRKPQLRGSSRAPPPKKQKRPIVESDEEDADEDAEMEDATNDKDNSKEEAEDEQEEKNEPEAPSTPPHDPPPPPLPEPPSKQDKAPPLRLNEAASGGESVVSGRSEPSSATATPSASPVRRKAFAMDTIMNEPEELDEPTSAESTEDVVGQDIRDRLSQASTEQKLLEVLTDTCGRLIKEHKAPSRLLCVGILAFVKQQPKRFAAPSVAKYLLRLLRSKHYVGQKDQSGPLDAIHPSRPTSSSLSTSGGSSAGSSTPSEYPEISLPVLITNILVQVLKNMDEWPEDSVKVFLDDALYSRYWVDHELSQLFVRNVKTIAEAEERAGKQQTLDASKLVRQRFHGAKIRQDMRELITSHIRARLTELEKEKGGSNGPGGSSANAMRNVILTLADFVSLSKARVLAAENMDAWLQNPSVKPASRELLSKIAAACSSNDEDDRRTVDLLLKMKLKSTMFQTKVEAVTQLVRSNPAYLKQALSVFIARERPNNMGKDVDNIKMVQHIFRAARASAGSTAGQTDDGFYRSPTTHFGMAASRELARVVRELASVSDVAPVLKTIVRKVLKQLTFDQVDVKTLCVGILDNEGHWDALTGDARLLDYMGLVSGIVWLVLLTRGAAVKNLQIQQSNVSSRQAASGGGLGGSGKHTSAQPIPRRGSQSIGIARGHHKLGGVRDGKITPVGGVPGGKGKQQFGKHSTPSAIGSASVGAQPSGTSNSGANTAGGSGSAPGSASSTPGTATPPIQAAEATSKSLNIAVRAKEELHQALACVQREAILCCASIFRHFDLNGNSPFEKMLYEAIVKKLLFLDIPPDVQPTEHDRTCFVSTKEGIPVHDDSLYLLGTLYNSCRSIDRMEALRTLESVVFRAAEGHLSREQLWRSHHGDLKEYAQNGGVLGIQVNSSAFVPELLKLTMWDGEKAEHDFCHSNRFWVCCSILLIVGCFNPETVGRYLWHEVPTLRSLMEMTITGRFAFPATNDTDTALLGKHQSRFPSVVVANQQLIEYEDQVSRLVQDPAAAEDPLMVFELDGIARQPPAAILEHLRTLDRKFRLGVRLRQCRSPDFLMEMVSTSDDRVTSTASLTADGAWWIADIVREDFETVQYLPHGCLCKLLLLALSGRNASLPGAVETSDQSKAVSNQANFRSIIPRLLVKLREYLSDDNVAQIEIAASVILYYLECLSSPDLGVRHVASQVLHLLTSCASGSASASNTESESMSTPLTSDLESIEDEILAFDSVLGGAGSASMLFGWIFDLVKFPCYSRVRPKIFASLEGLLERESSIPALRSCIKALYDFWNGDEAKTGDTSSKDGDGPASKTSKNAIEKSFLLAGAYGRLLSGREFIGKLLLQDRRVFFTIADAMWRVIELQLASAPQLKANVGISFSDCKVFYVADASNAIREIKLPLSVIHGAILALCSPHARDDGAARGARTTGARSSDPSFSKLAQSLFPKAVSGTAILSSTGLIATKDSRLYPDHLLSKLAASSSDPYLCRTAVRAMTCDAVWGLLQLSALQESCFAVVVQTLLEMVQISEAKVVTGLQAATKHTSVEDAAAIVLASLSVYKCDPARLHRRFMPSTMEALLTLERWLRKVSSHSKSDSDMNVDHDKEDKDDQEEEDLLAEGFSSFANISAAVNSTTEGNKHKQAPFYAAKPSIQTQSRSKSPSTRPSVQSTAAETRYFDVNYLRRLESEHSTAEPTLLDSEGRAITQLIHTLVKSCKEERSGSGDAASKAWRLRVALLHYMQASCFSQERTVELVRGVHAILDHTCQCPSPSHRQECGELVQQILRNTDAFLSYSDAIVFVKHIVQVGSVQGLSSQTLEDPAVSSLVAQVLEQVAAFVARVIVRWKATNRPIALDVISIRGIVVLLKDIAVLRGVHGGEARAAMQAARVTRSTLLWSLVGEDTNTSALVDVIDAVVSSMPHFLKLHKDSLLAHDKTRREMIGALYFQNPKQAAIQLDALYPGWESLVKLEDLTAASTAYMASIGDEALSKDAAAVPKRLSSNEQLVAFVDEALNNLKLDSSDAMDRFREIARQFPLLVLSRFPKQFTELLDSISLTRIYLNTPLFQNILQAMETLRPCLRAHMAAFPAFCDFLFQLLGVIADHHATDFYALIARIWDAIFDALDADYAVASAHVFTAHRLVVLRSIIDMYAAAHPDVTALGDVIAASSRGSEPGFHDALVSMQAIRSKQQQVVDASQQQQIDRLIDVLSSQDDVTQLFGEGAVSWGEVERTLQSVNQLCSRSRLQDSPTVSLKLKCAPQLAKLLSVGSLTKSLMSALCQTLVALLRYDGENASVVMPRYISSLQSLRPALKESAVAYVLDFLSLADTSQRQEILQLLFDDSSDIARSKLVAYLKSPAFRASALATAS